MGSTLIGQRSGRLTVLALLPRLTGPDPRKYDRVMCKCDCGKEAVRAVKTFLETYNSSCGCAVDHTLQSLGGRTFGKLTAMFLLPRGGRQGRAWTCRCECGRSVPVRSKDLRFGNTKSCGCTINRLEVNRDAPSGRQDMLLEAMAMRGGFMAMSAIKPLLSVASSSAVTRNVTTLERRGLLLRQPDPDRAHQRGGRGKLVHLLPAGRAYVQALSRKRAHGSPAATCRPAARASTPAA